MPKCIRVDYKGKSLRTILFLTNVFPFPGNSGGTIKTRRLIDGLIENNKVILCFIDTNQIDMTDVWKTEYTNRDLTLIRVYNGNNIRSVKNMLLSIFNGIPLNIYRNKCMDMHNEVRKILDKNKIDVIIVDHLEMFQYVPEEWLGKTILHEHNAEYKIWSRYAKVHLFPMKTAIAFEARRLEKYEKKACKKVSIVMAAPKDLEFISGGKLTEKYLVTYHMGNDDMLSLPELVYNNNLFNILFIGTLTWQANIEGIRWFIEKVFPVIDKKYPDVNVYIIGKFNKGIFNDIKFQNIHFCGFVEDLEEYMKKATVFICPLFFGSGMKVKIIEAMYRGIPFVTTKVAIENIKYFDENYTYEYPYAGIVTDNPDEFAAAILTLYENGDKWNDSSKTARLIAGNEYRWKDEIKRFNKVIDSF